MEKNIKYKIKKSHRAKRLRLAVYCDGTVVVTAPAGLQKNAIHEFVDKKRRWIYEKLRFFQNVDNKAIRTFSEEDYVENKEQTRKLVVQRVEYFQKLYDVSYKDIIIKNQKTRWGSCSKKGNLNFNYKLIFLPENIRDYIIVHEMCHLFEFNHSKRFWKLVQKGVPEYKDIKKQLQEFELYYK